MQLVSTYCQHLLAHLARALRPFRIWCQARLTNSTQVPRLLFVFPWRQTMPPGNEHDAIALSRVRKKTRLTHFVANTVPEISPDTYKALRSKDEFGAANTTRISSPAWAAYPSASFSISKLTLALIWLLIVVQVSHLKAQTCTVTDYLYLNDVSSSGGYVHKLRLNAGISATEIFSSGTNPWFPAGGILDTPHGLGQDLNGNLYIGQTGDGPIAKIKCNGTVVNASFINDGGFNIVSKDGYLYVDDNGSNRINRYSLCDGSAQGYIVLNGDFSYGTETLKDWGMEIDPNGTFYVTAGFNVLDNNKNTYIYRFKPTDANFTAHTAYTAQLITGVGVSLKPGTGDSGISNTNEVWGITHDPAGNMYVVVRDRTDDTNKETWILKYDKNFNLVDYIMEKDDSPTGGIEGARGIVYYAPWDRLLIAGGPDGDCIAKVRPSDMAYTGALAPNEPGQTPKTLRIASEACPVSASLTVDTTMCGVQAGDKVFLQNIIGSCKAPICGGTWTASAGNAGITFNECDLSFTVTNVAIGCGKFTLKNVGGTCGDFTIVVNVDFANVTAPVIAGNQTVCASSEIPATFTTTTAATGSNTVKYQWQKSTTSCTDGFSNIAGATASTYTPTVLSQTTYYRVITTVDGSCATPHGSCADTSNCVTVTTKVCCAKPIVSVTPGTCNSSTNLYSISGTISLTNASAGTATITDGTKSTTVAIAAAATSVSYSLAGLTSGTGSHTVTVSLPGCGTDDAIYTAPASCTVAPCALNVVVTPGVCNSATNQYAISGTVSLTSAVAGTMTITDGSATTTITVAANQPSVSYTLSGLLSDGASHMVVASLAGCGTDNITYNAPASCTVCTVNLTTASLPNGQVGAAYSQTLTTTGGTKPYTYAVTGGTLPGGLTLNPTTGVISGTPMSAATSSFTIKVTDSKSCTDAAALSITISAAPVCSLTVTATPGACNVNNNNYRVTGTISATNTTGNQSLTISVGSVTTTAMLVGDGPVSYTLIGLPSDGLIKTVSVLSSETACGSASVTYTAPASCSVAPCGLALTVTPGLCLSATNSYVLSGSVVATNVPSAGTLTIASGAFATRTLSLSAGNTSGTLSYSGLVSNGQTYTVTASYSDSACSPVSQTYTAPASCSVAPVCSLTATATAGLCATATNTYSSTAIVRLTNPTAGVLTVTDGVNSATFVTTAATSNTFTAIFNGLLSNGSLHTVTASLPGCSTTTTTYTAPASCSTTPICSLSAVATPGLCQTATNTFTNVVVVTLKNPIAGILTVTDGPASLTFATTAVSSATFTATFAGISSNGAGHTVTASLPGCSTTTTTYTAPASCSVAPVCSLTATATAGLCATATNTYSATAIVRLTNPTAGLLTITNGVNSVTFATTAASSATFTGVFSRLVSDGVIHTVTATLPGCSTASTTYTAPASCSTTPICSVSATVTAGLCASATNTYSATAVVTVKNPAAGGTLTVRTGGQTLTFSTTALSSNTFRAVFNGLVSDGGLHTVTASLPGCSTATASYTAPASCSAAPVCSLSAVVSTGLCATATNTFSNTVTVTLTNATAGTLTVNDGVRSVTFVVPASLGTTTAVATFNGIVSNGSLRTVTVSLPGCSSLSTTYTAPTSCSVCTVNLTTASLPNGQVGTAYSQTIQTTGGTTPYTYTVSAGTLPGGLTLNPTTGVISGTPMTAATSSFTVKVTDSKSCTDAAALSITTSNAPVCSLTVTATPGACNVNNNNYRVTGTISATNTTGNQSLTISVGSVITTAMLVGDGPVSYTLIGLPSDGLTHTVTVMSSATACGMASVTYTAPASCTVCSLSLTTTSLPKGQVGTPYAQTIATSGGTAPLTYTVSAGSLPAGLTLNSSTGLLSGTPTTAGSFTVTLAVTDSKGCSVSLPLTILDIDTGPICSLGLLVTPGSCNTVNNAYTLTGTVSLTNNTTGGTITITNGLASTTLSVNNTATSVPFSLTGLVSDGSVHSVTASLSGCGSSSTTYTAPQSCTASSCEPPIHVCKGSDYAFQIDAPTGQTSYQWYRNGIAITGATLSSYTATQAGSYSVVVNGEVVGACPNGSCCPVVIVEDSIALYQAQAQAPTCSTASASVANADGRILVLNWRLSDSDTTTYFYEVSLGSVFNPAQLIAGSASTLVPANGVLVANLANPASVSGQAYTVRISSGLGCSRDVVVTLPQSSCSCPAVRCVPFVIRKTR